MDEYKEQYYAKRPDIRQRSYGDISDRLAIREKHKCKSFKWYMQNVYPELPLPNENLFHGGSVRIMFFVCVLLYLHIMCCFGHNLLLGKKSSN